MPRKKPNHKPIPFMTEYEMKCMSWCLKQGFNITFIPVRVDEGFVETIKIVINERGRTRVVPDKKSGIPLVIKMEDLHIYERKLYVWYYDKNNSKIVNK